MLSFVVVLHDDNDDAKTRREKSREERSASHKTEMECCCIAQHVAGFWLLGSSMLCWATQLHSEPLSSSKFNRRGGETDDVQGGNNWC